MLLEMRRALATVTVAFGLLLANGCSASVSHGALHVRAYDSHRLHSNLCASTDCGPYAAQLRWSIAWSHTSTGYYVYLNHRLEAKVPKSPWALGGMDCGTSYSFGVRARDRRGQLSRELTAHYTTPRCSGPVVRYYVAQDAAGTGRGSSCANAAAVSTLSTPREWTPGNVIGLCGTISADITAHGSGTSRDRITIYFEPGATLSQPACAGACLTISNSAYITVDGGSDGIIESTANGSGLANQMASDGIEADPCDGCKIENLTIENIYRHTSASDSSGGAQSASAIVVTGSNFVVANNTIDNAGLGIYDDPGPADSNDQIHGNNIYDTNWSIALIRQSSGGDIGPIYIYGNHLHDWSNWDTTDDAFHHNGLHCYTGGGASTLPHYTGLYFYDNRLDGTTGGANATAQVWFEPASLGAGCGDSSSNFYVFNNVFSPSDNTPSNGELAPQAGDVRVYNNTLIGPSRNNGIGLYLDYGGTVDIRNNLIDNLGTLVQDVNPSRVTLSPAPDYDFFANSGSNAFVCNGYFGFVFGLLRWRACTGGERHATVDRHAFSLNADGSLPSRSVASRAGENLYAICQGQPNPGLGALCESIDGVARPRSGPWPVGAY